MPLNKSDILTAKQAELRQAFASLEAQISDLAAHRPKGQAAGPDPSPDYPDPTTSQRLRASLTDLGHSLISLAAVQKGDDPQQS